MGTQFHHHQDIFFLGRLAKTWHFLVKVRDFAKSNEKWCFWEGGWYPNARVISMASVTHSEFFLDRPVHISNPRSCHHGWQRAVKVSKFVPPDALNMHYVALSVFRFLCKTFFKLLTFTLQNNLLRGWFFKNSYIQMKSLYG